MSEENSLFGGGVVCAGASLHYVEEDRLNISWTMPYMQAY